MSWSTTVIPTNLEGTPSVPRRTSLNPQKVERPHQPDATLGRVFYDHRAAPSPFFPTTSLAASVDMPLEKAAFNRAVVFEVRRDN